MRPPTIPTTIPVFRETDTKQTIIMKTLYNTLINYKEPKTHRLLIQVFMCLPSRKDFPEYFNIVERPISMNKIRDRIEKQQYIDEAACMEDFKLMFSNCKFFNEDDSQIYNDASTLENILIQRREQLLNEYNVSANNDSQDGSNSRLSDNSFNNDDANHCNNNSTGYNVNQAPSYRSERLANKSTTNDDVKPSNNTSPAKNNLGSPNKRNNHQNNTYSSTINNDHQKGPSINTNHHDTPRSASPNRAKLDNWELNNNKANGNTNNNGIVNDSNDSDTQESGSNISSAARLINGKNNNDVGSEDSTGFNVIQNHNHDVSMDSMSNISSDLLASTPIEKCSLNNRRGRNSEAPKRQLLTGYIIYASEIRKEVIDKNPNQNFGDISRLVGNEWKALPRDIRSKYDQRALIHNKRVREKAQRDLQNPDAAARLSNGFHTPKLTKRKLAKLAKERLRQEALLQKSGRNNSMTPSQMGDSNGAADNSSGDSPNNSLGANSSLQAHQMPGQPKSHIHQYHAHSHLNHQQKSQHANSPAFHQNQQTPTGKPITTETATQTTALRFVCPSNKKRLSYSETFRKYILGSLQVPNKDQLNEELGSERPQEKPMQWLGGGIGRHESPQAALWALRDFMLQDSGTMRRNLQPYI